MSNANVFTPIREYFNSGNISSKATLSCFLALWEHIPDEQLYETFKWVLTSINKTEKDYHFLFRCDIRQKILEVNKCDTVGNPTLQALASKGGYLTVYHAQTHYALRNCNFWAIEKDLAIWNGQNEVLKRSDPKDYGYSYYKDYSQFICFSGKVKLDNVITFIDEGNANIIVALQENVRIRKRESFQMETNNITAKGANQ